ncbi:MAG TPA: hypothetical protein VFM93_00090 [Candidatus Limnocylindria bacterium]|nr:hypothetical protein [Candidatus Limnocylindria bacterium]
MSSTDLFRAIPRRVRALVPASLGEMRTKESGWMVKCWYGNADLHYEAWHRGRQGVVEIGLHFEADGLLNAQLLGGLRAHEREIRARLPDARLETWDKGWTRIWEPVRAERVDAALCDDLARRLARYVATLEPILRDELPVEAEWSVSAGGRARARTPSRPRARAPRSPATRSRGGTRSR